ncbi:hypothetical protein DP113_33655 (plasmid) [Brasilonema octagenarum UFV-E1]|uniref:DUF559 domain-containing protein n=2 Tax=Brasilonema TaxID=383614 RepID=A0A856MSR7_9CYAN|nr:MULTISPECIES: hypothetical protein [Brasilonema]NMF62542.1 hypothetical protein [Brasilonema octagenarum UFV-OR1]QDL12677.1 hypothetical protein DP114_33550 [Brasilonema sennae CENA114]QDL19071.1 hypothetical protein DP113_33655 [Brasilonema octagenarum UFV-E1]
MAKSALPVPSFPQIFVPQLVRDKKFAPVTAPSGTGDAPVGASENLFGNVLKHYFGEGVVLPQQKMLPPGHDLHYTADFLIVEPTTGLHLDVEVDEPISFATGKPTHCIGEDNYRNKCFVDANWVVVRFAEEQVSSQPERCALVIAGAIAKLTGNTTYEQKLRHAGRVDAIKQWTPRQATKLKKSNYRQGYLASRN